MTASIALIILVVGIIVAIVIGNKFKINSGIICIGIAYIVGCYLMDIGVMSLVAMFPVKIFFLTFAVCYFFGFHTGNGTFDVLSKKLLYAFRGRTWALPLVIVLVTAVVSVLGAGPTGSVVAVAPVAYLIAVASGYNPVFVAMLVNLGSIIGGVAPWSPVGTLMRAYASGFYGDEAGIEFVFKLWIATVIISLVLSLIAYFVFRGYKSRAVEIALPPKFNTEQKKSLIIIIIFILLAILPILCNALFGGPVFAYLARKVDVQMVAILGGIVCTIMKMGNEREIITKQVPWNLILLSGGFATFIAVCSSAGAVDLIASAVNETLPSALVTPIMAAIGAVISFVADGLNVGFGTFGPTFPAISAATGVPMMSIAVAFTVATSLTAFSPFSMGGALVLSLQPDETVRSKQFNQQILIAIIEAVFVVLVAATGFFGLFA